MRWLNHPKFRYLLLLPIVFLVINAMYARYQTEEMHETMLRQKLLEVTNAVDMIGATVEADQSIMSGECTDEVIREGVKFTDELHYIYAAAFVSKGYGLELISERNNQTDFDPRDYPAFMDAIVEDVKGNVVIRAAPANEEPRDLHIYFRWMPTNNGKQYLVVAGVSSYSVVTEIPRQVFIMQWITMGITFVFDTACVLLLCYLGHIYERRVGGKGEKWRGRRKTDGET